MSTPSSAVPDAAASPSVAVPTMPARRSWSTGSVLLGIGALCLIVAGFIFVTVAWGALGIVGRALILLAVTAAVGAVAAWATRRRLRGTAESLWAVFFGLLTIDWLAADVENVLGDLEFGPSVLLWGVVIVVAAVLVVRWARDTIEQMLVVPQVALGAVAWVAAPAFTVWLIEHDPAVQVFWIVLAGAVVAVMVAVVAHLLRAKVALWGTAVPLAGFAVALAATAFLQTVETEIDPILDTLPMLTLVAGVLTAAWFLPRFRPVAAGASTVALAWLLWDVVADHVPDNRWDLPVFAACWAVMAVVVLLAWSVRGGDGWSVGVRWASAVLAGALGLTVLPLFAGAADRWAQGWETPAGAVFWARPDPFSTAPWWVSIPVAAGVLAVLWAARGWPAPRLAPGAVDSLVPLSIVWASAVALASLAVTSAPHVLVAWVTAGVGAALAIALRGRAWPWAAIPVLVGVAAAIAVPGGDQHLMAARSAAAVAFAVIALVDLRSVRERAWVSATAAGLGVLAACGVADRALAAADLDPGWHGALLATVAAAVLLVSMALDDLPEHRIAVELAAALVFVVAVGTEIVNGGAVALILTIGAVVTVAISLLDDDRRWFRWVAVVLLGLAWIVRLAASEVETVEAYTAPFAVAILAAGVWRLRTDPDERSWRALTPGLTLALLPSVPQTLDDPTSVRALLLALVAAGLLAAGIVLRWGAPVVFGAVVVVLVVLLNIGPSAFALSRWVLIGAAGLVFLFVGTTWEKRVAEGRAFVARIVALR